MSYKDVMELPVYIRKYFINNLLEEKNMSKQRDEQIIKNEKGKRTRKISGEALKNKIKNNEINPF